MLFINKNISNTLTFPYSDILERDDFNFIIIIFSKQFHVEDRIYIIPKDEICINYKRSFSVTITPELPQTSNHFDYTVMSIHDVSLPLDTDLFPEGIVDVLGDTDLEKNILHQGLAYQDGIDNNPLNDIYK